MKNNLSLNNSKKNTFGALSKYRNYIVLGIILVFLVILGVIIYRKMNEDEIDITNNILDLKKIISSPDMSNEMENINEPTNFNSQNVNLLNNVKDRTVKEELDSKKQVYNIGNNIFTYNDARAVCKAHDGELATYHQVVDSYKKGGEWCNYGWSEDQMALYPTQKKTWEKLQEDPDNAGMCGNWGVNGGYFDNPNTLFGANCYGIKPNPKNNEKEKKLSLTKKDKILNDKIRMYRNQRNEMTVKPFNSDLWSEKGKADLASSRN